MILKTSDYCTKEITTLKNSSIIKDAIKILLKDQVDIVCVVDKYDKLIGIISKSIIFKEILNGTSIHSPIEKFIRKKVVTLNYTDSLDTTRNKLLEHDVSHGVVLGEDRKVFGVLRKSDIIRGFLHEKDLLVNQFSGLIEGLEDAVISVNSEMRILTFNRKARELFNLSQEDIIEAPISDRFPELEQDFHQTLQNNNMQKPKEIKIRNHVVIGSFIPITLHNRLTGAVAVLQDITKLESIASELAYTKRLQKTLHHALALSYDAILVTDSTGWITSVNSSFTELFDKTEDEVINKHWSAIIPNFSLKKVLDKQNVEGEVQNINGKPCVVTQAPIIQSNQFHGTISKIIFRNLDTWKDLFYRLEQLENELNYYKDEFYRKNNLNTSPFDRIISNSPKINDIKYQAILAAKTGSTILITGDSGTGKELFAEAIHEESGRNGEFIRINCAAIPTELVESELFGYEGGAFTGAKKEGKLGKFELANHGTLFLDEIGDMPLSMQAKLLRVLQEQKFERVGDTITRKVDVRIITATNKDLKQMVRNGEFREDLYYRVDVINLYLPPLKERIDDIPLLCDFLIKDLNERLHKNVIGVTSEALNYMQRYNWPGNIRQLENILERAFNLGVDKWIEPKHLSNNIRNQSTTNLHPHRETDHSTEGTSTLDDLEKKMIVETLNNTNNNRSETARLLGISRSTLYYKLKKYGIEQEVYIYM